MALSAFGKEFKKAREAGKAEFTFKGKKYNTRKKGESKGTYLRALETNRAAQNAPVPKSRPTKGASQASTGSVPTDADRPIVQGRAGLQAGLAAQKQNLESSPVPETMIPTPKPRPSQTATIKPGLASPRQAKEPSFEEQRARIFGTATASGTQSVSQNAPQGQVSRPGGPQQVHRVGSPSVPGRPSAGRPMAQGMGEMTAGLLNPPMAQGVDGMRRGLTEQKAKVGGMYAGVTSDDVARSASRVSGKPKKRKRSEADATRVQIIRAGTGGNVANLANAPIQVIRAATQLIRGGKGPRQDPQELRKQRMFAR